MTNTDSEGPVIKEFKTPKSMYKRELPGPKKSSLDGTSAAAGFYAFLAAIGFGVIVLIFILFMKNLRLIIYILSIICMSLSGLISLFLFLPKFPSKPRNLTFLKSYFLAGALFIALIIVIVLMFQNYTSNYNSGELLDAARVLILTFLSGTSVALLLYAKSY